MPMEPIEWTQLDWRTRFCYALECYNVTTKEDEEDPRNITIIETERQSEVEGSKVTNLDISEPLKLNK